ncbi:MAG: Cyclic nucleotide-binding protein [Ramlibacter sp.]|nr:Cyclic nucleotide-binding protein [Ramlibacter sp.]
MLSAHEPLSVTLRRAPWGAALDERDFAIGCQGVFARDYAAGALIAAKGEPVDYWLGVLSGMVKVDTTMGGGKSTTIIGITARGWLGEGSLLKKEPRPYEVFALQDTRMAFMRRETFEWLYENSLAFNHFLVGQLNARLGQFVSLLERARVHATPELIAYGLATLLDSDDCRVCISQEELGRLCGVSRQVAARGLHKLMDEGVIDIEYGAIRVKDIQGLHSAARM